ncbi:MAG: hypothetical protein FJ242_00095 [Nitrospira sp.]|nr:hypothetical protein [Nitrospira sp.]
MIRILFGTIAVIFILGCAGEVKELQMRDTSINKDVGSGVKTVIFPNGTVFGGASKEQASALAQIFVDSHNMAMKELEEIKDVSKKSREDLEIIKKSTQKIEETTQKNLETAQLALRMLEQLSKRHGTGEITLFFPVGSSVLNKGTLEYERLVNFVDYLSRESKGRKVLLISIGSASAFGDKKINQKLAIKRSEVPVEIVDKYLVNVPHEFFRVYSTGDFYSPKNISMKEHQRYQHTRIIAFYETDQIPPLPEEPAKDTPSPLQK